MEKKSLNLALRICEYGYNNKSFTLPKLKEVLNSDTYESTYIWNSFVQHSANDPDQNRIIHIYSRGFDADSTEYTISPSAMFSYIDHMEVVEARKAAKEAKRLSWIAIWITLIIGIIQIFAALK
jgi:hypothetical protein